MDGFAREVAARCTVDASNYHASLPRSKRQSCAAICGKCDCALARFLADPPWTVSRVKSLRDVYINFCRHFWVVLGVVVQHVTHGVTARTLIWLPEVVTR